MNKKILIGRMLVLTLLILMPTIPAIQQNTLKDGVKDRAYNDLVEQLNLKDIREIKELGRIRHPFLYLIVCAILVSRLERGWFYYETSIDWDSHYQDVIHPLLYFRGMMLMFSAVYWGEFWTIISNIMRWNWPM